MIGDCWLVGGSWWLVVDKWVEVGWLVGDWWLAVGLEPFESLSRPILIKLRREPKPKPIPGTLPHPVQPPEGRVETNGHDDEPELETD